MKKESSSPWAGAEFRRLRNLMQWTQADAAHFLGVSKKAIESYEQGWRNPPTILWKDFLLVIALKRGYPDGYRHCWEIHRCSPAARDACFCARHMRGLFCWAIGQAACMRHLGGKGVTIYDCLRCPVTSQFLGDQPGPGGRRKRRRPAEGHPGPPPGDSGPAL